MCIFKYADYYILNMLLKLGIRKGEISNEFCNYSKPVHKSAQFVHRQETVETKIQHPEQHVSSVPI